jgi:uncharacterized membrane protein
MVYDKPMRLLIFPALTVLAACSGHADGEALAPGDMEDTQPFFAIAEDDVIRFAGTEPFWGGEIAQGMLTWTTPENIDGDTIAITRFAGRGGVSFSGQLQGQQMDMAITPAPCSDGMSERTYPFVATVAVGDQQLIGCAWTAKQSYTGVE